MTSWKFDNAIAEVYEQHVTAHIPRYQHVIEKTINLCIELCSKDDPIIDIGCATGITLNKLHQVGFSNLYGVDSSEDMVAKCDKSIATISCAYTIPPGKYKGVLLNWVLHFNANKIEYLTEVYKNLTDDGFVVISEKISEDPLMTKFYYKEKMNQGLSALDIEKKKQQLQGVMNIHSVEWYLRTFNEIGFSNVHVIDADWCFASFLLFK